MKTLGIGVDIIDNSRINHLLKNKNFINRTFSKKEIFFSKKRQVNLGRFIKGRIRRKNSFKI